MFESCLKKQQKIKEAFASCQSSNKSAEASYEKIIDLGKRLPRLASSLKTEENLVKGCQSATYLKARLEGDVVFFKGESDAFISNGLLALLLAVYNKETPETILKCKPTYLTELNISTSLTPGRANGLAAIYLRIKQEALKLFLMQKPKRKETS